MKVLFLHSNSPDYLSSGLFHGLRSLLGKNCVDLPRFDSMYKPFTDGMRSKLRGNGFTLYGLLDDIPELAAERFFIWEKNILDYDLYVIANIWHDWQSLKRLCRLVPNNKIVVIDSIDSNRIFPFNNYLTATREFLLHLMFTRIPPNVKYFKREIAITENSYFGLPPFVPSSLYGLLGRRKIYPISFSIPEEKIKQIGLHEKKKMFAGNIVDAEVSKNIPGSVFTPLGQPIYKFNLEEEYYNDIQESKFGITTKRSGWDCLRHYEFAANGAVLCFKNLDDKHPKSAPHGLNTSNCIIYTNYEDLMKQIAGVDDNIYHRLLEGSHQWVMSKTTISVATLFLENSLKKETTNLS